MWFQQANGDNLGSKLGNSTTEIKTNAGGDSSGRVVNLLGWCIVHSAILFLPDEKHDKEVWYLSTTEIKTNAGGDSIVRVVNLLGWSLCIQQ